MFKKVDTKQNFPEQEERILKFWKENKILDKSIEERPKDKIKTFYDGPITANGAPHYGHMLTFSMKDIYPRYWTMNGFRVSRSLGWDCQGLPVEYEVEKNLGFKEKKDIEKYGIEKFNKKCRELVGKFQGAIIELEERIGRLTNDEEAYATMDPDYIESVWWSLKELHKKGLLYEGYKVMPYSPRSGTSLSNAEVSLGGYQKMVDPSIAVKFKVTKGPKELEDSFLLAWTTTPWTIPSNRALAVNKKEKYVLVTYKGEKLILAKKRLKEIFNSEFLHEGKEKEGGKLTSYEILEEFLGKKLVGVRYSSSYKLPKVNKKNYLVYGDDDLVNMEEGTGIVHLAAYGVEDMEIFAKVGIEVTDVLDDQGDFDATFEELKGLNYSKANPVIIDALKSKNLLLWHKDYEHDMPVDWRTGTPLIYKPITSWFIAVTKVKKKLLANNQKTHWVPKHIKDGRFGKWLEQIKDWGISRSRYWGTPLPIWKSKSGKIKVIGSFEELEKLSGKKIDDPHRPYVDEIKFEIKGEEYTRILDVIDVWYDSGAMPFARFHYPFENKDKFKEKFPAEYIAEGVDQTRGWFYSLMATSTALFGDSPYRNVIVNGTATDDKGAKLSKSKKNYEPPHVIFDNYGADATRMSFFTSPIAAGVDAAVSEKTVKSQVQEFLLPLWNSYSFLITYSNIHKWTPNNSLIENLHVDDKKDAETYDYKVPLKLDNELDRWIVTKLQSAIRKVRIGMDEYVIPTAAREFPEFLSDLSKWYIRRSRDRFAKGEVKAFETLYYVLVEYIRLLAPFAPFITEAIYENLVKDQLKGVKESIHLTAFPHEDTEFLEKNSGLLLQMDTVRDIVTLGQAARVDSQMKVRQPLAKLEVISDREEGNKTELEDWMKQLIMDELNVKEVHETHKFTGEKEWIIKEEPGIKVALDTKLTKALAKEGLLREISRTIQSERKKIGLQIGDKVKIQLNTESKEIKEILISMEKDLMEATGAEEVKSVETPLETKADANGKSFSFKIN